MYYVIFLSIIVITLDVSGLPTNQTNKFVFTQSRISVGSYPGSSERVIGGSDARPGEFPFQVSIQIIPSSGPVYHKCGGVIFDEYHIVTAAHCVIGENLTKMEIVAGAHNIKNNHETFQQRIQAKRAIPHPLYYGSTISYDGAVITLASPLEFNTRVQPLRLAPEGHEPTGSCITIGWGNANPTGGNPPIMPEILQKVSLDIIDRETCRELYSGINYVDETMICAGGGEQKGSCTADSGGPIICSDLEGGIYMAGIVSWTVLPCGQARFPTVFCNVAYLWPFWNSELFRP